MAPALKILNEEIIIMKKAVSILLIGLCAAFAFTACSAPAAQAETQAAAPAAATEEPAAQTQAAQTGEPAEPQAAPPAGEAEAPAAEELSGKVQMSGSTSMETIANALAEGFMLQHSGVTVDVQLGGSSVGVQDALEGKSDIGNVSRELKEEEAGLVPNVIAIDGIAVIVHPDNPVTDISKDDLIKVYTGEINNWSSLGGNDEPIVVIGREASSGTRGAFEELLGIEDQAQYAQELNETGAVKTAVSATPAAVGYVSLEALDDTVTALTLDGVPATEDEIKAGGYALSRPFIMATPEGALRPEVRAFLDFALGADGQAIVADNKLITVG
jgi:phosphate transport system substrate-binding protein